MAKQDKILIHIEPEFAEAFRLLAIKRGASASSLGRILLLKELEKFGIIPTEIVQWLEGSDLAESMV